MILRTRFAPSPTGFLHLGHVAHLLYVWGVARAAEAEIVLRIEDHDRQRCKPEYEAALLEDLEWLGLLPDLPGIDSFRSGASDYRQSNCGVVYAAAAERVREQGLLYHCDCSRAAILRRTGPQHGELRYDNFCRDLGLSSGGLRLRLSPEMQTFTDLLDGTPHQQTPAEQCGDLLLRDRHGQWTYQFCVVVDDLRHGVNLVIRGTDLLASTARQLQLAKLLGRTAPLHFLHHPLLIDAAGNKLSKRDFALGIRELRQEGRTAAEVLGMAAFQAGLQQEDRPHSPEEIPERMFRNPLFFDAVRRVQGHISTGHLS